MTSAWHRARHGSRARRTIQALLAVGALAAGVALAQTAFRGDAAKGALKAEPCAVCHGTNAQAPVPGAPVLDGQRPEYLVLQMFLFREGLRDVPQMTAALKGFTDPDLNDLAAHYAAQPPGAGRRKADAQRSARGAEIAGRMGCGSCHMADFSGQREVPRLAAQSEDYLVAAMKAYRADKRVGADTNMNGIMRGVSDGDIEALAHYLAHL